MSTGRLRLGRFLRLIVEESLGVPIPDEEVLPEHFDTVNALTDFVLSKMPAALVGTPS